MQPIALDADRQLRLFVEEDAAELYAVIDADRAYLARWMPWAAAQTFDATLAFIRAGRSQLAENQGFQAAIIDRSRIVGSIGFHRIDWANRATSIGYWLAEAAQGRGTVTLSVGALVRYAFEVWDLHRVEIVAAPENRRSRAIPQRLGFTEEGVLRQSELVGDRYHDGVVYGLLADEWRAPGWR